MVASYFLKVKKILVKICFLKWRYKLYILCNIKFLTGLFHWSGLTLISYVPLTFSSLVHAAMPVSLSLSILFSILSCCSFSSLSSLKLFSVLTPVAASSFLCCMAHMFLTMFPTLFFWKPQYLLNVSLQYAVSDVFSLLSKSNPQRNTTILQTQLLLFIKQLVIFLITNNSYWQYSTYAQ